MESGDHPPVAVLRLLIVVASLVAERLEGVRASVVAAADGLTCGLRWTYSVVAALGLLNSVAVAHRLSCPMACGVFRGQGSNPCFPHCKMDS